MSNIRQLCNTVIKNQNLDVSDITDAELEACMIGKNVLENLQELIKSKENV